MKAKATPDQIIEALEACGGFITHAAKQLGMHHSSLLQRIQRNKRLTQKRQEIEERYLDIAESKLISKVQEKDLGAICFFLKCKGKQRGYVERQEIIQKEEVFDVKLPPKPEE